MFTDAGSVPLKRNLYIGLKGEDVAERQHLLNALADINDPLGASNLAKLEADGVFGLKTLERVKEFQLKNDLIVDGVIGSRTDAEMDTLWIRVLIRHHQNYKRKQEGKILYECTN